MVLEIRGKTVCTLELQWMCKAKHGGCEIVMHVSLIIVELVERSSCVRYSIPGMFMEFKNTQAVQFEFIHTWRHEMLGIFNYFIHHGSVIILFFLSLGSLKHNILVSLNTFSIYKM